MYYVAQRQHSPPAPHPAPRARWQPVRRGAVRRRGIHRPQLAPLPPRPADADAQDRDRRPDPARGRRRRPPPPPLDEDRGGRAEGRRRHRPDPAVLQPRRHLRRRPPGRGDAGRTVLPQRDRRRDAVRPRGQRRLRHDLRAAALRPGRLPRAADRDDLAARPGRGLARSGSCTSRRRRRSSRRSAIATTTASSSSTRRTASATSTPRSCADPIDEHGDFVIDVRSTDRITAYHYRHHPFDVVGWDGYLWPFRFNIADFQPITGPGPPAAAGPPDVPGPQLRRLLVRAAQVRLPPARDPGAVQPLEHQQRRGHLLRRRQLHEPARAWRSRRSRSIRPGSRTGRTRARSRRRSARRRPRSWR